MAKRLTKRDWVKLKIKLLKEQKKHGEIGDDTLERLEDEFHKDLTHFYGEGDDPKVVTRLINKLNDGFN